MVLLMASLVNVKIFWGCLGVFGVVAVVEDMIWTRRLCRFLYLCSPVGALGRGGAERARFSTEKKSLICLLITVGQMWQCQQLAVKLIAVQHQRFHQIWNTVFI